MKRRVTLTLILLAYFVSLPGQDVSPQWEELLKNYLIEASSYHKSGDTISQANVYKAIANEYFNLKLYKQASSYFEREFALYSNDHIAQKSIAAEKVATSFYCLQVDTSSAEWYGKAISLYEAIPDDEARLRCEERLASIYMNMAHLDDAHEIYERVLEHYRDVDDKSSIAHLYNNLGCLEYRRHNYEKALTNFNQSLEYASQTEEDPSFLTDVYSNISICYQALEQKTPMVESFKKALSYSRKAKDREEEARIEHILAIIYYTDGDNYHADIYCSDCLEAAKEANNYAILQECYKTYSDVMERNNDFVLALEYYERHLTIRDSLNYESRLAEREESDIIEHYNSLEQELVKTIQEEEIQDLELQNLRAESARRENEIQLLQKQQELDLSERERLSQSLALERERNILSQRDREVKSLQEQQVRDSLLLKIREDRAQSLETANRLLESEREQEKLRAEKERQIRNTAIVLGVSALVVALLILFSLLSSKRKNQELAASKRHIEMINDNLETKNREISEQNIVIGQKNMAITDSILYASRIQKAVSPPPHFITEMGIDNFILLKPKDIVSGDFYWGKKSGNKVVVAAADCTGHGVPGAFMSMLGHAFLDEIMNTRDITNAADILNILRDEIISALRQKGEAGEARDGMDMSLVIIDKESGKIDYAGANNPLYLIRGDTLTKYAADSMPIGIHVVSPVLFTNNSIEVDEGDCLYIFSDGYADQFGGPKNKKFMYKPFQQLLLTIHSKPMEEQKKILLDTLMAWKGDNDQVDDILVIGMRM